MPIPFELTAAAAEDPRIAERLRAEPPDSRARLLAEADRLAQGGEDQRRLAEIVFCALAEDVDPALPDGARRAEWVVCMARPQSRAARALLSRTAALHPREDVRLRAASLDARIAGFEGDSAGAAEAFRGVARRSRGRRDDVEIAARLGLAEVAARHEEFASALVETVACLGGDPPSRALSVQVRRVRGSVFALLGDLPRCERELAAAETLVPHLSAAEVRAARSSIAFVRLVALVAAREPGRALTALRDAADDGGAGPAARRCEVHVAAAQALLALGRTGEAAVHVARAMRTGTQDPRLVVEMEALQVRLQHAAGGPPSSRSAGAQLVRHLAGDGRRSAGPARRAAIATQLARMLGEPFGDAVASAEGFDVAASAAHEAVVRAAALPPSPLPADDAAALVSLRARLVAARDETLRLAAKYLEGSDAGRRTPAALPAAGSSAGAPESSAATATRNAGRIASAADARECCPWCRRVREPGGSWLPAAEDTPAPDAPALILAACTGCSATLARRREPARV